MSPLALGKTMARDSKKTKADTAPKNDTAAKVESTAAKDTPKSEGSETAKSTAAEAAPKSESGETAAKAPSNYSRGEGQKPVSAAYKENWNAIFAKKKKR
jgi:hypothetical protein